MAQGKDEDGLEFKEVTDLIPPPDDDLGPAEEAPQPENLEVVVAPDVDIEGQSDEELEEKEKVETAPPETEELVEEPEAVPDGLDEDDKKTYSKSVRERIQREYRRAERFKEESQRAVMSERQARIDAQREVLESNKSLNEVLVINLENSIKAKTIELKKAKEDGDTEKEVDITGELGGLHARKVKLEDGKSDIERRITEFEVKAKAEIQPARAEVSPAAQKWLDRNRWVGHKDFKPEAFYLAQLDRQLAQTMSPNDPRYFQELDKRIAEEMPNLGPKIRGLTKQPTNKQNSAVAPRGRSAPATSGRPSNRVLLTQEDINNMIEHKLDPKNPTHLKAYAAEKRALER